MENLSRKDKVILIFLVVLGILCIYYVFLLKPVISDISNTNSKIKEAKHMNEKISTAVVENVKYKKQLEDFKVEYEDALKALPQSERDPEIAMQIKSLTDKNGMVLESLNFSKAIEAKGNNNSAKLMSIPITMNIAGDYENSIKLLKALEDDKRIVDINEVTFDSNSKGDKLNKTGEIKMVLNASYYFTLNKLDEVNYDFNNGEYGKPNVFK